MRCMNSSQQQDNSNGGKNRKCDLTLCRCLCTLSAIGRSGELLCVGSGSPNCFRNSASVAPGCLDRNSWMSAFRTAKMVCLLSERLTHALLLCSSVQKMPDQPSCVLSLPSLCGAVSSKTVKMPLVIDRYSAMSRLRYCSPSGRTR